MSASMIIIGAGLAGLTAGCYGQMHGYRTRVVELHDKPGGMCTAWQRKGYTFDGCVHILTGIAPESAYYPLWQDLGVIPQVPMCYYDESVRIEDSDGRALTLYADLDRVEEELHALSPVDSAAIGAYVRAVRQFEALRPFELSLLSPMRALRTVVPHLGALIGSVRATQGAYAERFRDPFLRRALPYIQYSIPEAPMLAHLGIYSQITGRTGGWPVGGSLALARAMERRYLDLGGEIRYRARATRVIVENDRAVGVRLEDGSEERAEVVVSAGDGRSTIFDLLGGEYADERLRRYYASPSAMQQFGVHVSLGVARDLSHEPHALTLLLDEPVVLGGQPHDRLDVEIYAFDPGMAPPGKTAVKVAIDGRYDYWKDLAKDPTRYRKDKDRLAEAVIERLDARFPGLRADVEVVDVATPLTTERYTANWRGLQPWSPPGNPLLGMVRGVSRTLPGLAGFHMVGQWAEGMLGIPTAVSSGRDLIRRLCRRDGRPFVSDADRVTQ